MRSSRRAAAALAAMLVAVTALVAGVTGAPGAGAAIAPVSSAHPYSNPVWYPMHAKVYLDCVLSNPGCEGTHSAWTMDFVRETLPHGSEQGDLGVYAMGAGRLHIGEAHGARCVDGARANFGTWVWIEHGGGVTSRYGHLSSIAVAAGTFVAAGQRIGTMGTTGKGGNCGVPYLDFQVRHHGQNGPMVAVPTLRACSARGAVQTWPSDLDAALLWRVAPVFPNPGSPLYYSDWNKVPQRSVDFPATSHACLPGTVPATPNRPSGVTLSRSGSGQLTARWTTAPVGVRRVQLRLSVWHPSTGTWDRTTFERYASASPTAHAYEFTGLTPRRTYRVAIDFGNAVGWSAPSRWVQQIAG